MGIVFTSTYNKARRIVTRYNFNHRAIKYIDKGIDKPSPRYENHVEAKKLLENNPQLIKELEDFNKKDPQLNEYLKKVYLTSTSEIKAVANPRSLPVAVQSKPMKTMFYEPENTCEGWCTLTDVIDLINHNKSDPQNWNPTNLAKHYKLDKKDIINLLTYYSLFTKNIIPSLNEQPPVKEKSEVKFEVYNRLEKKPLKQIEGKK